MQSFAVPANPDDLLQRSSDAHITVQHLSDLADLSADAAQDLADGVVYDLVNENALCITTQKVFDGVYSLVRGFTMLPALAKTHLVDSLCSSLSLLNASAAALLDSDDRSGPDKETVAAQHNSALQAYVFFLHWVSVQAEQASRETTAKAAPAASAASRGRTKTKKAAQICSEWSWDADLEKVAKAVAGVVQVDLWQLCRPQNPDEAFLLLWSKTAILMIGTAAAAKNKRAKEAAFRVLASCMLQYGQLEHLLTTLTDMLNKEEHMSGVCAELAEYAAKHLGNNQLAVELLREVASVSPAVYEQQQQADAAGVRIVASFIAELADRVPHVVASNISLLAAHLGGKAYPIRSAIVTAIGYLIEKAFEPSAQGADAQGTHARLRSKQQLLNTLVERVRDQNAYTRARVLQTWMYLAERKALTLGHWVCVTQLAVGRLEDKAAIVRKCALQLLSKLMCFNPFGKFLPLDQLTASLDKYRLELQAMQPAKADDADDTDPADPAAWAAGQTSSVGAASESPRPMSVASPGTNPSASGDAEVRDMEGEGHGHNVMGTAQSEAQSPAQAGHSAVSSGAAAKLEETRTLVASLQTAVDFVKQLSESLAVVTQLLASATLTDVQEAITFLIYSHKFQIHGAQEALRKMLLLMFSREQGVKDTVVDAFEELYLKSSSGGSAMDPRQAAQNLVGLAHDASLGELGALEEVIGQLTSRGLLRPMTLKALWLTCSTAHDHMIDNGVNDHDLQGLRSSLMLISMAAKQQPQLVADHLPLLLKVGLSSDDALVVRQACVCLTQLGPLPNNLSMTALQPVHQALVNILLGSRLQAATWFTAAEAAVPAIYALHPAPQEVARAVLQRLAQVALGPGQSNDHAVKGGVDAPSEDNADVSAARLSRFFFAIGQFAIQHLLHVERSTKATRKRRADAEKAAAEASHSAGQQSTSGDKGGEEEEDIGAQLGVGGLAADLELDALKEAAEAEIVSANNLLGCYAPLLAALCHNRALLGMHAHLRSSALLAMTKLMAIEPAFCEANLPLLFTLLEKRLVEPAVRSNLIIALGDLAFRFPNLLEPWTERIYGPLSDPDTGVRKNGLMVLTHLILNDMMKVKGHIARMAICLQDPQPCIRDLAHLFFHELSQKNYKGTSPIYNLLPDILSGVSQEPSLSEESFQAIMMHLLTFIGKAKQVDSLVGQLCVRFSTTQDVKQWRNIAFCLSQLSIGDKGFHKLADMFPAYKDSLGDSRIYACFQACVSKAKKVPKLSSETKAEIEAFEAKLDATAAEKQEEQAVGQAVAEEAVDADEPQDMQTDEAGPDDSRGEAGSSSAAAQATNAAAADAASGQDPSQPGDVIADRAVTATSGDSSQLSSETEGLQHPADSLSRVERQMQRMALQQPVESNQGGEPVHEDEGAAYAQKENLEPSDQSDTSHMQLDGSVGQGRPTHRSSSSRAAKSRQVKQSTDSSTSSHLHRRSITTADTCSAKESHSQVSAPRASIAHSSAAQQSSRTCSSAAQESTSDQTASSVPHSSNPLQSVDVNAQVGIPAKVQQQKASSDLDKLLGSKRKPVQHALAAEADRPAAESPLAHLRGQLRQVKLESSPSQAETGFVDDALGSGDAVSSRQTVGLQQIKQEPNIGAESSRPGKVSALMKKWETQSRR